MKKKLRVKQKTEIAKHSEKKDILTLYGVPEELDKIVIKEKQKILNNLNCGSMIIDSLNRMAHSEDFIVEIPGGLREMIESGKATFDKSHKNLGGYTPNVRIKGENGIKGQATIVKKSDPQAITQSVSNLAMMAMIQSVLEKLEAIEEKIEDIKTGQKDDRVGEIIGSFKGFMILYPTFKTTEEKNNAATTTYFQMYSGLTKLHLQIERDREKLNGAPANNLQALLKSVLHPLYNVSLRYQSSYNDYIYDIQLYNRLILLSDIILYLKGDEEAIKRNHQTMVDYCEEYIDEKFQKAMKFLMNNDTSGISNILKLIVTR